MKLGVVAFVFWSLVTISGAFAQCGVGAQICGTGAGGSAQTALATFSGNTPSKNSVFSVIGTTTLTVTTCSGNCTPPTLLELAGYFANLPSGGTCTSDAKATCTGTMPAGWSSGPVGGIPTAPTILYSFSPPGTATTNLSVNGAQGSTNYAIVNTPVLPSLASLLSGKMVCVKNTDVPLSRPNTWNNQEWHSGNGTGSPLWDYKAGSSTNDPSKQIGTWTIGGTNNCTVSYNYGSGPTFSYTIHTAPGGYAFCGTVNFTIPSTQIQGSGSLVACQ